MNKLILGLRPWPSRFHPRRARRRQGLPPIPWPARALIPRSALFGNPEKTQARLSPDGKYVSFIAPRDGVLNVWVAERGKLDAAKPITNDQKRGIRQHFWAYDNHHVLYLQDKAATRTFTCMPSTWSSGTGKDLTPYKGVQAQVVGPLVEEARRRGRRSQRPRGRMARPVGSRHRHRQAHAHRAELAGDGRLPGRLRSASRSSRRRTMPDGNEIFRRVGNKWVSLLKFGQEDSLTTATARRSRPAARPRILQSSVGRDKAALVRVDIATGKTTVLGASEVADVEQVWFEPRTRKPAGVHGQLSQARDRGVESRGEEGRRPAHEEVRRRIQRHQPHAR